MPRLCPTKIEELFAKAPAWAKYRGVDTSGQVWFFAAKPEFVPLSHNQSIFGAIWGLGPEPPIYCHARGWGEPLSMEDSRNSLVRRR